MEEKETAVIRLRGHQPRAAHLEVSRYPAWAWLGRIVLFVLCWIVGTWVTLVFTFDPFVASFPFVLGLGLVYHGIRGRYQVRAFHGACPRCEGDLRLDAGSKINLPHPMVCYACHHEPELELRARAG